MRSSTISSLWLRLTLIGIVFGLQFQLAGLELIVFHLDLQLFLLLFQGIFKFDKFLYVQGREIAGVVNVGGSDDIGPSEGEGLGLEMWAPHPRVPFLPSTALSGPGGGEGQTAPQEWTPRPSDQLPGKSLGALKPEEPTRSYAHFNLEILNSFYF